MVLNLSQEKIIKFLMNGILAGIVWSIFFFYIRKSMNNRNFKGTLEENQKKREDYKWDAIYGGLAVFFAAISKSMIQEFLQK